MSSFIEDENHSKCWYSFPLRIIITKDKALSSTEDKKLQMPKSYICLSAKQEVAISHIKWQLMEEGTCPAIQTEVEENRSPFFPHKILHWNLLMYLILPLHAFRNFWLWFVRRKILLNIIVRTIFLKVFCCVNTLMSAISSKKVYFYIQDSVCFKNA